ncbi:MAG: hypothetical protein ACLR4Z_09360 [Butyricicoccaceae bacterium]
MIAALAWGACRGQLDRQTGVSNRVLDYAREARADARPTRRDLSGHGSAGITT